jgi:hypothetical protein
MPVAVALEPACIGVLRPCTPGCAGDVRTNTVASAISPTTPATANSAKTTAMPNRRLVCGRAAITSNTSARVSHRPRNTLSKPE